MTSGLRTFILTGAGISAESGIPTFQGTNWRGHSHYDLANIEAWRHDPQLVWEYYSERRARARDAQPNPAHTALAELERSGKFSRFFLCTQNVDGLHEAAGSRNVVHIHGRLFQNRCADDCGTPESEDYCSYSRDSLPRCSCGALLRPNVCWFGEQPFEMGRVYHELEACNVFVAIGTSGAVQPVAGFVALLKGRSNPVKTVYIGLEEPANAEYFDEVHLGPASALVMPVLSKLSEPQRAQRN